MAVLWPCIIHCLTGMNGPAERSLSGSRYLCEGHRCAEDAVFLIFNKNSRRNVSLFLFLISHFLKVFKGGRYIESGKGNSLSQREQKVGSLCRAR